MWLILADRVQAQTLALITAGAETSVDDALADLDARLVAPLSRKALTEHDELAAALGV